MLDSKVTVVIPFKHNVEWLELCACMWLAQYQLADITVHIIDTENELLKHLIESENSWINNQRIEVAHLGLINKHHPSDLAALAYDYAFSRCLSPYILTTHVDAFPKHRNVVAYMLREIEGEAAVGWECSKRGVPAQIHHDYATNNLPVPLQIQNALDAMPSPSDGTIGMVCSLFDIKAMDIAGLSWSLRRCHHLFGTDRGPTNDFGWPDTESIAKYIFDRANIAPKLLGRETNFENQETEHWIHSRSMTLGLLPRHTEAFNKAQAIYESWGLENDR